MKKLFKNLPLAVIALVMGLGIVFTQSAFTEKRAQYWKWQPQPGSTDITDYQNYQHNGTPYNDCESSGAIPCAILVDDSANTPSGLEAFLDGKNAATVRSYATEFRP